MAVHHTVHRHTRTGVLAIGLRLPLPCRGHRVVRPAALVLLVHLHAHRAPNFLVSSHREHVQVIMQLFEVLHTLLRSPAHKRPVSRKTTCAQNETGGSQRSAHGAHQKHYAWADTHSLAAALLVLHRCEDQLLIVIEQALHGLLTERRCPLHFPSAKSEKVASQKWRRYPELEPSVFQMSLRRITLPHPDRMAVSQTLNGVTAAVMACCLVLAVVQV